MLREHRFLLWCTLAWFVVLEMLLVAAILFWPSFKENIAPLRGMVPIHALRQQFDVMAQQGVFGYVNAQHFFKGCNTVGTLAAVVFAMGAVAGEAHRGTLELMLSRPLSRRRILLERWFAGALAVMVPVFATSATVPWLLTLVDETMPMGDLMLSSVQQSALLLAVYSLTFLYSCLSSNPIVIVFTMLSFTVFQFAIYMIKHVTHFSIFRLTDIETFARIDNTDALDWRRIGPLVAVVVVALWLSLRAFARRVP
jgi:ABC-2 type transport system permease protein